MLTTDSIETQNHFYAILFIQTSRPENNNMIEIHEEMQGLEYELGANSTR